jgi:hypothetical protein
MLYGYKDQLYESLSLAVTRVALGMPPIEMNVQQTKDGYLSLESLLLQNHKIPVDRYSSSRPLSWQTSQFYLCLCHGRISGQGCQS